MHRLCENHLNENGIISSLDDINIQGTSSNLSTCLWDGMVGGWMSAEPSTKTFQHLKQTLYRIDNLSVESRSPGGAVYIAVSVSYLFRFWQPPVIFSLHGGLFRQHWRMDSSAQGCTCCGKFCDQIWPRRTCTITGAWKFMMLVWEAVVTHSPFTLSNLSSLNLVSIFSCSSPPRNTVYVRRIWYKNLICNASRVIICVILFPDTFAPCSSGGWSGDEWSCWQQGAPLGCPWTWHKMLDNVCSSTNSSRHAYVYLLKSMTTTNAFMHAMYEGFVWISQSSK